MNLNHRLCSVLHAVCLVPVATLCVMLSLTLFVPPVRLVTARTYDDDDDVFFDSPSTPWGSVYTRGGVIRF